MFESVASRPNAVRRLLAVTPGIIALYWIGSGLRTIWHAAEHTAMAFWCTVEVNVKIKLEVSA